MKKNITFIVLSVGVFMAALDNGIISAALTTINASFGVTATAGTWGITLYTLGLAIMTPIIGKLSDRYGRKKLFLLEIIIFTLGSLAVAMSPNFTFFLISRFIQSIGGGGIFIIASSHVINAYAKEKHGRLVGILGGMNGIAAVIGPNIGSLLMGLTGSWQWLFLVNLPIGILLVVGGLYYMEESKVDNSDKIDLLGITFLAFSILCLMFAVNHLKTDTFLESLFHINVLGFFILSVMNFVIFIKVEKKNERSSVDPILPYRLLRNSTFSVTLLLAFLSGIFIGSVIFIPSFVEQVLGIEPAKSGYWMTPLALASGLGAGVGGVIVDRSNPVRAIIISGILAMIGFGGLALLTDTLFLFIVFSTIAGMGFGIVLGAPLTLLISHAAGDQKGSALGTLSVARQIGLTVSPTIFGMFIQRGFNQLGDTMSQKLGEYHVELSSLPMDEIKKISTLSYAEIQSQIDQIPVENIRLALQMAFQEAAYVAYRPVYLTPVIAATLIIMLTIIFKAKFEQDRLKNQTDSNEY